MVNYLGKFINNLSELTAPLRTLLVKDSVWSLDEPQAAAINRLKEVLTTAPVLNFYNPSQPTRVSVDVMYCCCIFSLFYVVRCVNLPLMLYVKIACLCKVLLCQ